MYDSSTWLHLRILQLERDCKNALVRTASAASSCQGHRISEQRTASLSKKNAAR